MSEDMANPFSAKQKADVIKSESLSIAKAKREESNQLFLDQVTSLNSLDWDRMPVPILARLIMAKPFKGGRDDVDQIFMSPEQSLIYATEINRLNSGCDRPELKLSPFGNDVWPDLKTLKINVTVEGQRKIAARRNDLGIPMWKEVRRPFGPGKAKSLPWMTEDIGVECTIPVGKEKVVATAWMTNWFKPTPIWKDNWEHMLRVRSEGLCYEAITGVGISQPHDNRDIENVKPFSLPNVDITPFEFQPTSNDIEHATSESIHRK